MKILIATILAIIALLYFTRCGNDPGGYKDPPVVVQPPAPNPNPDPDCKKGFTTSFADLAPIIEANCARCHPEYRKFALVVRNIDEMIGRINLPFNDLRRMPLPPSQELTPDQKKQFEAFKADGLKEVSECKDDLASVDPEKKTYSLKYVEERILADLNKLDSRQQTTAQYLILAHKDSTEDFELYRAAINKALNSLSSSEFIIPPSPIDEDQTIYRYFLGDYGLTQKDYQLIIDSDKFKFRSQTNLGKQILSITNDEQPWLHADNFINIAFGDPKVYNELMRIPSSKDELWVKLGINIQTEVDNFRLRAIGGNGSPISQNKNRLVVRFESIARDIYAWETFDPNSKFEPNKNLFQFPLLEEMGGEAIFNFDAGEIIFQLKNGLQGYAIYNAAGERQDEAPVDVVQNINSPFSPIIKVGLDCNRCHNQGLIVFDDQIRDHVTANAANFARGDVDLVEAFYASNTANRALFKTDMEKYAKAVRQTGDDLRLDPMNALVDEFRADLGIEDIAAFLFYSVDEFKEELSKSDTLKAQLGQLLTGGRITLNQFQQSFNDIKEELRLGQDKIDQ